MQGKPKKKLAKRKHNYIFSLRHIIAEADQVFDFLLVELAGENYLDTAFAIIARIHDGFVFGFEILGEIKITAYFDSIAMQYQKCKSIPDVNIAVSFVFDFVGANAAYLRNVKYHFSSSMLPLISSKAR